MGNVCDYAGLHRDKELLVAPPSSEGILCFAFFVIFSGDFRAFQRLAVLLSISRAFIALKRRASATGSNRLLSTDFILPSICSPLRWVLLFLPVYRRGKK